MASDPRIGTSLASYRLLGRIGRGGMSVVYLAEDEGLGRRVALKVMDAALAEDEAYRVRFVKEARAAAALEHPNILPVYEAGESTEGELFIASRYVPDGDLAALLTAEGPLSPTRALDLLAQVAAALDAAHAGGLIHRDVKPANVLIDRSGTLEHAYLADFGITKHLGSASGLTRSGQFLGTADYMAPEQIEGRAVDGRTDVYSLGCVLYECLAGTAPFASTNPVAVLDAQRAAPPPRVTARRPELPQGLDAVIARAMAKDPAARYRTCAEVIAGAREGPALERTSASARSTVMSAAGPKRPDGSTRLTPQKPTTPATASRPVPAGPAPRTRHALRRYGIRLLLAATLAIAVAGTAIVVSIRNVAHRGGPVGEAIVGAPSPTGSPSVPSFRPSPSPPPSPKPSKPSHRSSPSPAPKPTKPIPKPSSRPSEPSPKPSPKIPPAQAPQITGYSTYREGQFVYFSVTFRDSNGNAIGFGFRGADWAEETHPFSDPSFGRVFPGRVDYPFNLECGTADAYDSNVEVWIYDSSGLQSSPVDIGLSC